MAKNKTDDPAPEVEATGVIETEAPAENAVPTSGGGDVQFVESKPFAPISNPKVSPLYPFDVVIGVDRTDSHFKVKANDEADAIRKVFDANRNLTALVSRVRRSATRTSDTPLNVEQLTVDQVDALGHLEPEAREKLKPKAIQPPTKAA